MLAIEIDGESHIGKEEYDNSRDKRLKNMGVHILRFDDLEVRQSLEKVIGEIERWIDQHEPTPNPSQEGTN